MDHISETGYVYEFHNGLVHKLIAIKDAMIILVAKASVDKERDKLKQKPAWDFHKAKLKSQVVLQAKEEGQTPTHDVARDTRVVSINFFGFVQESCVGPHIRRRASSVDHKT